MLDGLRAQDITFKVLEQFISALPAPGYDFISMRAEDLSLRDPP